MVNKANSLNVSLLSTNLNTKSHISSTGLEAIDNINNKISSNKSCCKKPHSSPIDKSFNITRATLANLKLSIHHSNAIYEEKTMKQAKPNAHTSHHSATHLNNLSSAECMNNSMKISKSKLMNLNASNTAAKKSTTLLLSTSSSLCSSSNLSSVSSSPASSSSFTSIDYLNKSLLNNIDLTAVGSIKLALNENSYVFNGFKHGSNAFAGNVNSFKSSIRARQVYNLLKRLRK